MSITEINVNQRKIRRKTTTVDYYVKGTFLNKRGVSTRVVS